MISTEPGPDDLLQARIRQALAGERFTVPTAAITGRMSRHRRRTWVAVVAVAVAAAASIVPMLTSIRTDRAPAIRPPVILPGPTGTTLDDTCRAEVLARLATGADLRPAERHALPPLRYASDLDGVRFYASSRVRLFCRWSDAERRARVSGAVPPGAEVGRLNSPDLDHVEIRSPGYGFVFGGLPHGVVAVEIELSDGRIVPAHVDGDVFVASWDGSARTTVVGRITAIGQGLTFRRAGYAAEEHGADMVLVADSFGNACKRELPFPASLIAASVAMGYRIYGGNGDQVVVCVATGNPAAPVELEVPIVPAATAGVVVPTVATVVDRAGALGLVMGRGAATDVELQVGGKRLRPAIHNGFYAAAVRGAFTDSGPEVTRWVYVDPAVIITGTGARVTSTTQR
ncbi:MAG: hypothetical protein ACRDWG_15770 [Actinomycetes bacterium]